jgi:phage tail-like protein
MPSLGLNAAAALVTNLLGIRADPYQGCNFLVEIEGLLAGGFSDCSGLAVETEVTDYREGGLNGYVHRFAGPTKYPPLVLKHGLSPIDGLWSWHQDVVNETITRRSGTIYLLNKMRIPVMWWDFKEAFPVKWTGPDLRADSGSVAIESVELAHRGLSRPGLATTLAGIGAEIGASFDISASLF